MSAPKNGFIRSLSILHSVPAIYWVATGVVTGLFVAYALLYSPIVFPVDDAYITVHNVAVLGGAPEVNYPGVPALEGATSIVHSILLVPLALVLQAKSAVELFMWLSIVAYVAGLIALARARQMPWPIQILFAAVGVVIAETPHQLLNGLETGLAMAAVTWTLVFAIQGRNRVASVLCGVLPFIRPELVVFSGLWLGVQAVREVRKNAIREFGINLLCVVGGAAPWLIILFLNTGSLIPTTIAAKQAFFAESTKPWEFRLRVSQLMLLHFFSRIGFLGCFGLFLVLDPLGWIGLGTTLALLCTYIVRFPSALGHYEHRYLYVLLPFVFYAVTTVWKRLKRPLCHLVTVSLVLAVALAAKDAPRYWRFHLEKCNFTVKELDGVAQFCNRNLPAGSTILIHDAGYISYATKFQLVDMVGLKTPAAVRLNESLTLPSAGKLLMQAVGELAAATRPDYIVVLRNVNKSLSITEGLQQQGWKVQLLHPTPGEQPTPAYFVYRLQAPASVSPETR